MFTYKYPHPAMTADCCVFGFDGKKLHILLIERGIEPYRGMWALPGGFMRIDETIEECAARELREETGLSNVYLEQFGVFSAVRRDPRERVVTVAFLALVRESDYRLSAGDDAANASWFDLDELPPLAFDHTEIIVEARKNMREILKTRPIAFKLLDRFFSMTELQNIYEAINDTSYDRRNFAKKMAASGFIHRFEEPDDDVESDLLESDVAKSDVVVFDEMPQMLSSSDINMYRNLSFDDADVDVKRSVVSKEEHIVSEDKNGKKSIFRRFMKRSECRPTSSRRTIMYEFDEESFMEERRIAPNKRNPLIP